MHVYCVPCGIKKAIYCERNFVVYLVVIGIRDLDSGAKFTHWMSQNLKFNLFFVDRLNVQLSD